MVDSHDGREKPVETMRSTNGRGNAADGWTKREFTNWVDEQLSWKETCYIGDWSFLSTLRLTGPEAIDLLSDLTVNSFENFPVGKAKHAIQCNDDGHVIAEGVLMRTGRAEFVVHGVPGYWLRYNLETASYDASTAWQNTFNYQVQGPDSLAVLETLTESPLRDIEFIHFDTVDVDGRDVTAVRMGMAGELGFELQGPAKHADEIWAAVVDAGQEYGIRRLGSRTALINHLEACFPTRGRDYVPAIFDEEMDDFREWMDEESSRDLLTYSIEGSFDADDVSAWYRTPVELGWGRNVAFDHDFLGRRALEREVDNPRRTIVTLVWDQADVVDVFASLFDGGETHKFMDVPRPEKRSVQADEVKADGERVGVSTSRGYSYSFREMLSLCTIYVEYSEPGTEVTVLWGEGGEPVNPTVESHVQKEVQATVAPASYKEDRRRIDTTST